MTVSTTADSGLDRAACRLLASYGKEAALVAYTKAVVCETSARMGEAQRWRGVLARIAAVADALEREVWRRRGRSVAQLH